MTQRYQFTEQDARAGGRAVITKRPPETCPECGKRMAGRSWHSYLGHLGLHGLAQAYFGGDVAACQRRLRRNGQARQDPTPWNGALPEYVPVSKRTDEMTQIVKTEPKPACPDCGAIMVLRRNRNTGQKFWACNRFPDCRGTRDIDEDGEPVYYDWEFDDD